MASLIRRINTYSDGSFTVSSLVPDQPLQLYQHKEDIESGNFDGKLRGCAYPSEDKIGGCPAVMPLRGDPDTIFNKHWQLFLYAINFGMTRTAVQNLLIGNKALTNEPLGTKLIKYITGENLNDSDAELPRLDKLRTFSRSTHAAIEIGDYLKLLTLDGNLPPPLKPGKTYPENVSQVNPDDYLYLPKTHRHLFMVCNNVRAVSGGSILFPFDNGLIYDWIGDGMPYVFFPLVSWFRDILVPKSKWVKLASGSPIPSPYRK